MEPSRQSPPCLLNVDARAYVAECVMVVISLW